MQSVHCVHCVHCVHSVAYTVYTVHCTVSAQVVNSIQAHVAWCTGVWTHYYNKYIIIAPCKSTQSTLVCISDYSKQN